MPYCYLGLEVAGNTAAEVAVHSPNPWVFATGATFKVADFALNLASDLGTAALDRRDQWLGAKMVVAGQDASRLKQIKAEGGNLDGPEAQAIKARLAAQVVEINGPQESPIGYTTSVIVRNLPYAVAQVGIEKAVEAVVGHVLDKAGIFKLVERRLPLPEQVNWALNYGGPLEDAERAAGWTALGKRARAAAQAAEEERRVQEAAIVAGYLKNDRIDRLKAAAADALVEIYQKTMSEHPSQPRSVVAASFRLAAARAAVMLPAAAVPVAAIVPAVPADPVVGTIQADDWVVRQHYGGFARPPRGAVAPSPAPAPPSASDVARWAQLNQEYMRVGDGRTFTMCSNGCPVTAQSSWDGGRHQGLYGR